MILNGIEVDCWIASDVDPSNEIPEKLVVDYDDETREISNPRMFGALLTEAKALRFLGGKKAAQEYLDERVRGYLEENPEEVRREIRNERRASMEAF